MNRIHPIYLLFIITSSVFGCHPPQGMEVDGISKLLRSYESNENFNGSVLVAKNDSEIFKGGFGYADRRNSIKNTSKTIHKLASVSKQFIAYRILQLVEDGKVKLHQPIKNYLKDYPTDKGSTITVHHLLTHTSGIPDYGQLMAYEDFEEKAMSPKELVDLIADSSLNFTPGKEFQYSNSGYMVLGYMIEQLTEKSLKQNLEENIFKPLNMFSTALEGSKEIRKEKSIGYSFNRYTREFYESKFINMSTVYAAGAIYSTVEDLHKWHMELLSPTLLNINSISIMLKDHIETNGRTYGYGIFNQIYNVGQSNKTVNTISHGGGIYGYRTLFLQIPSEKLSIAILSNATNTNCKLLAESILGAYFGESFYMPKPSFADTLNSILRTQSINKAEKFFDEHFGQNDFDLNELEINSIAYELMLDSLIDESEYLFKLNINKFPYSFNVYDSYGEFLISIGQLDKARRYYNKSFEIDTNNLNALRMIKKIDEKANGE